MLEEINALLLQFKVVKQLGLDIDPFTLSYDLILVLANSEELSAQEIQIKFEGISQLNLSNFGGGLMQFMHLTVHKLHDGLERQNYEVQEMENDAISFRCCKIKNTDPLYVVET